ncbi:MAG: hypothetical protein ACLRU3_01835 [Paraclostridium sp.]
MKTTATLGLKKPDGNDVVNIDDFNFNADKIDLEFGKVNEKFKNIDTSADKISIKDANDNFTSTTVEGALNELFQNVDNGKSSIATAIVGKGVEASKEDSFPTLANKISSIKLASGNAQPSDVLSGKTFTNTNGNQTGTMPNRGGATTVNPGPSNQVKPSGYYRGDITIKGDANLVPSNIKEGATVFGVLGTFVGGKKFASGSVRPIFSAKQFNRIPYGTRGFYYIMLSDLGFKPSTIITYHIASSGDSDAFMTIVQTLPNNSPNVRLGCYSNAGDGTLRPTSFSLKADSLVYVNDSIIHVPVESVSTSNNVVYWVAYQ